MAAMWRKSMEKYGGLEIQCAPGVHAAAAEMLSRHGCPRSGVMDMGSGSGVFLARLRDLGYTDLFAIERESQRFKLSGVTCLGIDLQTSFAASISRRFHLVTAIEVIEHLESPLAFLRQAAQVLEEGGYLLFTTPNVAEWKSRIKFLLRGELRYFDSEQYAFQHHISPILPGLVPDLIKEAGLQLVAMSAKGTFDGCLKQLLCWPASSVLGCSKWGRGECLVVLARKPCMGITA